VNKRESLELVVAIAAAPYLTAFLMVLKVFLEYGPWAIGNVPSLIVSTLVVGTYGLVLFGPVVAFVVCVLAIPLIRRGFHHPAVTIAFGAAVGMGFRLVSAYYADRFGFWPLLIVMALAGALCGWIYWLIARERTSQAPGAIDPG
jgi:hypothetical protein